MLYRLAHILGQILACLLYTSIHEIAHAKLHAIDPNDPEQTNRPDSRTREVQAESCLLYTSRCV